MDKGGRYWYNSRQKKVYQKEVQKVDRVSFGSVIVAFWVATASAMGAPFYTLCQSGHGIEKKSFAVSAGQAGLMVWNWKCADPKQADSARTTFEIRMPRGFAFLDAAFGDPSSFKTTPSPEGGSIVTFKAAAKFNGALVGKEFNGWNTLGVLVESTGPVGTFGNLEIRVFRDGELASAAEVTRLETVEPIHVARPRRCRYGMCVGSLYDDFQVKNLYMQQMLNLNQPITLEIMPEKVFSKMLM